MKKIVNCTQSAHLDLFWMARMDRCLRMGAEIIDDAVRDLAVDADKRFVIETVRFLEYYLDTYPQCRETVQRLLQNGQLEVGACYTDRLENHHDGESLVRNVLYGKQLLHEMVGLDSAVVAHPDLPGLAEQTPQIYHQTGVRYYTFARGYHHGARFHWAAPNGESIIAYNYPIHYSYYDYNQLYTQLDAVEKAVHSDTVFISLSAGDLGPYGTFQRPHQPRENTVDLLAQFNARSEDRLFRYAGIYESLSGLDESDLPTYQGECPCKWGTYGSATNVLSFKQDKRLSAALCDAEKLVALCALNGVDVSGFHADYPFCLLERPHMLRDYYDAKIRPETLSQWIDFAWRLQLITQDHNYGGIDGVASAFDRFVYKKCAIQIGDQIIAHCLQRLASAVGAGEGLVAVNPLNWKRSGKVYVPAATDEHSVAVAADGACYALASDALGVYFEPELEALSYAHFRIAPAQSPAPGRASILENDATVTLASAYYTAVYDKAAGGLTALVDRFTGQNLLGSSPVGIFSLYADPSNDVHEELYHKTLLDTTRGNVTGLESGQDALCVWVKWTGEIGDSKVCVTLRLSTQRKEFSLIPEVYWVGQEQTQLRFSLGLNPVFGDLYYGVPYGIQKFGQYMTGAEPTNPTDEISMELFREYREVQGWFAVQSATGGVSFGTDHSSFAFRDGNDFELMLIRDVVSCGDVDVMMDNHGHHTFTLMGTSFGNDDVTQNDLYYRRAMEVCHPLVSVAKTAAARGELPAAGQLLQAQGGILSVLRVQEAGYQARVFSVRRQSETVAFAHCGKPLTLLPCNMLGQRIEGDLTLAYGDIRTLAFAADATDGLRLKNAAAEE